MTAWAFIYVYGTPPNPKRPYGVSGHLFPDAMPEAEVVAYFKLWLEARHPGSILSSYSRRPGTLTDTVEWRAVTQ